MGDICRFCLNLHDFFLFNQNQSSIIWQIDPSYHDMDITTTTYHSGHPLLPVAAIRSYLGAPQDLATGIRIISTELGIVFFPKFATSKGRYIDVHYTPPQCTVPLVKRLHPLSINTTCSLAHGQAEQHRKKQKEDLVGISHDCSGSRKRCTRTCFICASWHASQMPQDNSWVQVQLDY